MNSVSKWSASAVLSVSIAVVVAAQAPALDVKMGLWELTSVGKYLGQTPSLDTSGMTPEQKAQMESAMKDSMGPQTSKSCVTKEKLEKSVFMMDDEQGQKCKQTVTTNTRSTLAATVTCTGPEPMTGQMHVDALSPTAIKYTMTMSGTQEGRPAGLTMTMTGKWLSADCGRVK